MVGPKKQDFWPRINILKDFFFKSVNELRLFKKVPKLYFQSQFSMTKIFQLMHLLFTVYSIVKKLKCTLISLTGHSHLVLLQELQSKWSY